MSLSPTLANNIREAPTHLVLQLAVILDAHGGHQELSRGLVGCLREGAKGLVLVAIRKGYVELDQRIGKSLHCPLEIDLVQVHATPTGQGPDGGQGVEGGQ